MNKFGLQYLRINIFSQCKQQQQCKRSWFLIPTIPNKLCEYTDTCKILGNNPKICQQGFNKFSCQNVTDQICQFNKNQCSILTTFDSRKECSKQLSQHNCITSPFLCFWQGTKCVFKDSQCEKKSDNNDCYNFEYPCGLQSCTPTKPLSCFQFYNRLACLDSGFFCYWDNIKGCQNFMNTSNSIDCKTITLQISRRVCQQYASQNCEYRDYVCTPNLSDIFYELNPNYLIEINLIPAQLNCSDNLTEFDCVTSTQLKCIWDITCKPIEGENISCVSKINILACQQLGCLWRQRKCIFKGNYIFRPNPVLDEQIIECIVKAKKTLFLSGWKIKFIFLSLLFLL